MNPEIKNARPQAYYRAIAWLDEKTGKIQTDTFHRYSLLKHLAECNLPHAKIDLNYHSPGYPESQNTIKENKEK